MSFSDLSLLPQLLRALGEEGYVQPTPIQAQAIPHVLAGRDLLGLAQTGTGKTAAFALPVLQRLATTAPAPQRSGASRPVRALVITPTRELASQIAESFGAYGRHLNLTNAVIFGGVSARPQEAALKRGVDILVATPGRLLDHMRAGLVHFDALEVFVLDEADRMLDMGFVPDVKRIIAALPKVRQNLFFSATMPKEVRALAGGLLVRPAEIAVVPPATTAEKVEQSVYAVAATDKRRLLVSLLGDRAMERVLVFTRTKSGANRLVKYLDGWNLGAAVRGEVAGGAGACARGLQGRGRTRPRRDGHRGTRDRRRWGDPCRELRPTERARELCPSHWAHGARWGGGEGHRLLLARRATVSARHREDHPDGASGDAAAGSRVRPGSAGAADDVGAGRWAGVAEARAPGAGPRAWPRRWWGAEGRQWGAEGERLAREVRGWCPQGQGRGERAAVAEARPGSPGERWPPEDGAHAVGGTRAGGGDAARRDDPPGAGGASLREPGRPFFAHCAFAGTEGVVRKDRRRSATRKDDPQGPKA